MQVRVRLCRETIQDDSALNVDEDREMSLTKGVHESCVGEPMGPPIICYAQISQKL